MAFPRIRGHMEFDGGWCHPFVGGIAKRPSAPVWRMYYVLPLLTDTQTEMPSVPGGPSRSTMNEHVLVASALKGFLDNPPPTYFILGCRTCPCGKMTCSHFLPLVPLFNEQSPGSGLKLLEWRSFLVFAERQGKEALESEMKRQNATSLAASPQIRSSTSDSFCRSSSSPSSSSSCSSSSSSSSSTSSSSSSSSPLSSSSLLA
jgi:hypothetical protein